MDADAGLERAPLDDRFERLVRDEFDRLMARNPVSATYHGIHDHDARLGDQSREGIEEDIHASRRFLAAVEAIDAAALSPTNRIDREVAELVARRQIFDLDVHCVWERRPTALDEIGDGLFLIFARDFAPLEVRLSSMTGRLEDAPRVLAENRHRLSRSPIRLWVELELRSGEEIASLFDGIVAAGRRTWGEARSEQRRLESAVAATSEALEAYLGWLREIAAKATNDGFPLGEERYAELLELRAFDGLASDEILEIGEQQLAAMRAARDAQARRIDPEASVEAVVDRVKSDHPSTFEAALDAYREVMFRARDHVVSRGLATLPPNDRLSVIPTPDYLRNVMPFAAYFEPGRFDVDPSGIYVITPSVDDDPSAMREHNFASISNTSIHEAYPGHHLQLSAAITHPSLARALVDAPEFVEGWGMYGEQMMREEGFDAEPHHLLMMYTDAVWRACRIILDIRLHLGEIGIDDAIEFLVRETRFERPQATAEVHRYTYTPTYQLSYLLGKVMLLRLREDERQRLRADFSLRRFHDALLYAGSLPISFHRRLLAGEGGGPAVAPLPAGSTGGLDAAAR